MTSKIARIGPPAITPVPSLAGIIITDDARAWLAFLADARLMLGTRLDVTEDDELIPTDDPEHNLYLYLGYLQQSLVEELMGG